MTSVNKWGPWSAGIDAVERTARLRSLRTLLHVQAGPRSGLVRAFLTIAEHETGDDEGPTFLSAALDAFNALPSLDQRCAVAAFGSIHCPRWNS